MPKPKDDANLPAKVREVKAKMEEVVSEKYPGFIVPTVEDGVNITKGTKGADRLYASFSIATTKGGVDRVIAFRATKDESIKLTVEMLKAVGVPVKDDFSYVEGSCTNQKGIGTQSRKPRTLCESASDQRQSHHDLYRQMTASKRKGCPNGHPFRMYIAK